MTNYHKEEYSLITFTKELLDRILQSIDIPIVLFDQNARIIYVNERFYRYVKTTPKNLLNQKIDINSSRLKEELFFFQP